MSKAKKQNQSKPSTTVQPEVKNEKNLLSATLPNEAKQMMSMVDEQVLQSQKSMQEALNASYQLINQANHQVHSKKNLTTTDADIDAKSQQDNINETPNSGQQDLTIEAMQRQVEAAQEAMHQSLQKANQQVLASINNTANMVNQGIEHNNHPTEQVQQEK